MEGTAEFVRSFMINNFMFDTSGEKQLDDTASFLDQGIIDSTGVLELVEWIEERFGFSVADDELIPENLDSVNNLVSFIDGKIKLTTTHG